MSIVCDGITEAAVMPLIEAVAVAYKVGLFDGVAVGFVSVKAVAEAILSFIASWS